MPLDSFMAIVTNVWFSAGTSLLTILFVAIVLRPLYLLSRSRAVLFLMFSKAIGMFIGGLLSFALILFVQFQWTLALQYSNVLVIVPQISIRIHLFALALNRVHCVYFPLHYASKLKRRMIMKICCLIWLFSIFLSFLVIVVLQFKLGPAILLTILNLQNIYRFFIFASLLLYLCFLKKFIELKRKKFIGQNKSPSPSSSSTNAEKDHFKMSIVCIVGLVPFIINLLPNILPTNNQLYSLYTGVQIITNLLCPITEEFCLMIICEEFRALILKQLKLGQWKAAGGHGNGGVTKNSIQMFVITGHNNNAMSLDGKRGREYKTHTF